MEINSIDKPNTKKTFGDYLKILIYKLGGTMEIAMIIFFWLLIFNNTASFEGFSREEIITYILVGGIIGLFGGYMLSKIIIHGISHESIELLIKDPYQYFLKIFKRSLDKMFIPFVSAVFLQVILLYFLVENIIINLNLFYWVVILIMIFLSLISEFLMFYLFRILFITNIESKDIYHIIVRLKNIFGRIEIKKKKRKNGSRSLKNFKIISIADIHNMKPDLKLKINMEGNISNAQYFVKNGEYVDLFLPLNFQYILSNNSSNNKKIKKQWDKEQNIKILDNWF